jgi:hypothetical protein
MTCLRQLLKQLVPSVCAGLAYVGLAAAGPADDTQLEDWFEDDTQSDIPQVGQDELVFLSPPPVTKTLHSINTLSISESSLDDGWVQLKQCYEALDAVPDAEVVYRYRNIRHLRIHSKDNIGRAVARDKSVQLVDVQHDAMLCIQAEVQILYPQEDGGYVLRNGPFHRRFLDGYFPLHVSLIVKYPSALLQASDTSPASQPGFEVDLREGSVYIDTWFAGTLNTEVRFVDRQ